MKLLALFAPEMHILICTHTNSVADLYVEELDAEWKSKWHVLTNHKAAFNP